MHIAFLIVIAVAELVPCLWIALFLLSWRDARRHPRVFETQSPQIPVRQIPESPPAPRNFMYWFLLVLTAVLHAVVIALVWPGILGAWVGSSKAGQG
jgi:hypothetical protein